MVVAPALHCLMQEPVSPRSITKKGLPGEHRFDIIEQIIIKSPTIHYHCKSLSCNAGVGFNYITCVATEVGVCSHPSLKQHHLKGFQMATAITHKVLEASECLGIITTTSRPTINSTGKA